MYFFETPWNFSISPWKFQAKQSPTPRNSKSFCQILQKFQGQKPRSLEITHYFFLVALGNFASFLINCWKFHILTPHCLVFFCNSPIQLKFSGLSYILQQVGKCLSNSKMGHVQASKRFHHLVWNDPSSNSSHLLQNYEDPVLCLV